MKNESAFPETHRECHGLTKLEYFAGRAMQGIYSNKDCFSAAVDNSEGVNTKVAVASFAIGQAKELIKQLEAEK